MKCTTEFGVYVKAESDSNLLFGCLYVDDLLVTGNSEAEIFEFKEKMMQEFEMTDLGLFSYFLGIEFKKTESGMVMHQGKYVVDLLKKFIMFKCNPAVTPAETGFVLEKEGSEKAVDFTQFRQMVGSLRYLCHVTSVFLGY